MKLVRALLQHHVDDGAPVVAELGREAVVLDFELLHDLDRRLVVDVGVAAFALFRRTERAAVEGNLRGGVALAVGDEVGAGGIVVRDPEPVVSVTPPARNTSPNRLRPYSGMSRTYSLVTSVPRVALSVSSKGAAVVTPP